MDRRQFLKTLGAMGLTPLIPSPVLASVAPAAAAPVPASTYKWAEVIVRAHQKCNLSMLERLLNLDPATASALKSQLIENGVISAAKSQYGFHSAMKPLYQEVFPRPHKPLTKLGEKIEQLVDDGTEEEPLPEPEDKQELAESIHDGLPENLESNEEPVDAEPQEHKSD